MPEQHAYYLVKSCQHDGEVIEHGDEHQSPGLHLEIPHYDEHKEHHQDEVAAGQAVNDVALQPPEYFTAAVNSCYDGANALLHSTQLL